MIRAVAAVAAAGLVVLAEAPAMAQTACVTINSVGTTISPACHQLPNKNLTPGAVASTSRVEVCGRNAAGLTYSKAHRHTTETVKRQVAEAYGVPWDHRDRYEFDHLVPLELGGADTIANLWPQPWQEASEKDLLEDEKARDVCDGRISLDAAQRYFLGGEWEQK